MPLRSPLSLARQVEAKHKQGVVRYLPLPCMHVHAMLHVDVYPCMHFDVVMCERQIIAYECQASECQASECPPAARAHHLFVRDMRYVTHRVSHTNGIHHHARM